MKGGGRAMKLNVYELIGENCLTMGDGQKVYDLIHSELSANRFVELDFTKVGVFASPFFNVAIGQLLRDIKSEDLNCLLKVSNMTPAGLAVLRRVLENSKRYYSDEKTRKAVDEILLEKVENL